MGLWDSFEREKNEEDGECSLEALESNKQAFFVT